MIINEEKISISNYSNIKERFLIKRKNIYIKYFISIFILLIFICIILNFIKIISYKKEIFLNNINEGILYEIEKIYNKTGKVNINEIENKITDNIINKQITNSQINIGFTLNPGFILQTMLTVTSIMSTQYKTTKIIFHFGITKDFTVGNMMKIYQLKKKLNNLTEFNFYYLKEATEKMNNFQKCGPACPGKFELPELLPKNVERLIIFDAGDVLVFRDLTELYNYNMKDFWALGTPEPWCIDFMNRYNRTKYINIGSVLLNVKELKKNKFWENYIKNRFINLLGARDQTLFNIIVPDEKKNYFPLRFGGLSPFKNDKDSDKLIQNYYGFQRWINTSLSKSLPEHPGTLNEIINQLFNPVFIHQFDGKWKNGNGLSKYRIISKYFIKMAGIWDELCSKHPGYCK